MGCYVGEFGLNFFEVVKERMVSFNFCKFFLFFSLVSSLLSDFCDELYEGYNDYDFQLYYIYMGL